MKATAEAPERLPFRRDGGPEGNRTPDLFHAKNEIGGSPFSAFSAAFVRDPLPWMRHRDSTLREKFRPVLACQEICRHLLHPRGRTISVMRSSQGESGVAVGSARASPVMPHRIADYHSVPCINGLCPT